MAAQETQPATRAEILKQHADVVIAGFIGSIGLAAITEHINTPHRGATFVGPDALTKHQSDIAEAEATAINAGISLEELTAHAEARLESLRRTMSAALDRLF